MINKQINKKKSTVTDHCISYCTSHYRNFHSRIEKCSKNAGVLTQFVIGSCLGTHANENLSDNTLVCVCVCVCVGCVCVCVLRLSIGLWPFHGF